MEKIFIAEVCVSNW